jgi:hypothetical protein
MNRKAYIIGKYRLFLNEYRVIVVEVVGGGGGVEAAEASKPYRVHSAAQHLWIVVIFDLLVYSSSYSFSKIVAYS